MLNYLKEYNWTNVRNGKITNDGINNTPKEFNPQSGLSNPKNHDKIIFMKEHLLSEREAYLAMYTFLVKHQQRTNSDDLGSLLGDMQINNYDGKPMDAALWNDWLKSIAKVKLAQ